MTENTKSAWAAFGSFCIFALLMVWFILSMNRTMNEMNDPKTSPERREELKQQIEDAQIILLTS